MRIEIDFYKRCFTDFGKFDVISIVGKAIFAMLLQVFESFVSTLSLIQAFISASIVSHTVSMMQLSV